MTPEVYLEKVNSLNIGKKLIDSVYLHHTALVEAEELLKLTEKIAIALKIGNSEWNIAKFHRKDFKLSFLNYPEFETHPFPSLLNSYSVDLSKLTVRKMDYTASPNPPILHRKELLLKEDDPRILEFSKITQEAESLGLFINTRKIGFKLGWEQSIKRAGFRLTSDGEFEELAEEEKLKLKDDPDRLIQRYRTAINRKELSQPMQALAKAGFLGGEFSILDYGCGKGDDVNELTAHGLDVSGWDPNYYPDGDLIPSDIVNLGFVLNVIENKQERDETLMKAWDLANKLLIVSVMLANDDYISQFQPYLDGVITKRKTFQKYYSQGEFREYLERTINESSVAMGQGVFILFKDKEEEQKYLLTRQYESKDWINKTYDSKVSNRKKIQDAIYNQNKNLFDEFWTRTLSLGRTPREDEFANSDEILEICGSLKKGFKFMSNFKDMEYFQLAQGIRKENLIVYFSLGLFEKRKAYSKMPESLKADVKEFFGSYKDAMEEAKLQLFSVGDPTIIEASSRETQEYLGCGELNEDHDYIFLKDYLSETPTYIRIYVGCAARLFGDIDDFQLIKVHFHSAKVTFLNYDNWESDNPILRQRVKCKLRDLEVDIFDYGAAYDVQQLNNKNDFFKS